jgi:HK97 gp10 family phage protein
MSYITGVDDLKTSMQNIADSDAVMEKSIRKWTEYVRGEAVDLCPVDTGELQQSIHASVEKYPEPTGIVYTNKEYAPYVEFGTGRRGAATRDRTSPEVNVAYSTHINGQEAQPFLYPALNNNRDRIMRGIKEDLRKGMKA